MTMASPPPSEEERRLLREYRLTTVPSRRSSCSPATSNTHQHHHGNHHHHHKHHGGHHHHSSNHKKLKSTTPTQELTPDELSRMLELVSGLSYLKLVPPIMNGKTTNTSINCINSTDNCKPYIFEKVDYIKKISIRRKALKKLKKARSKTRLTSPNSTESPKIKL